MNIKGYLDSLDLSDGESRRSICPSCNSKNTFTITKELGTIKYNCYKLNCDVRGNYHVDLTVEEIKLLMRRQQEQIKKEPDTMEIPEYVVQPTPEHTKFHAFKTRWGLNTTKLLYDVKDERVVFPIHYKGRIIDANGRSVGAVSTKGTPKWYRYTGKADYYMCSSLLNKHTLLLVEDCTSAEIAVQEFAGINSMAILGTSLTDKHYDAIGEFEHIVIALDPDAAHKTIQYKREIEAWTGIKTTAVRLDDDIKYKLKTDIDRLEGVL